MMQIAYFGWLKIYSMQVDLIIAEHDFSASIFSETVVG